MLLAALCGPRSAMLLFAGGFKSQLDYIPPAPPAEPIGVDPDAQPQHRFRLRSNDRLDRLPVRKFDPAQMEDSERAAFLAVMAEPDTQPVVDQFRRFGAYFVAGGWIECDIWRIIPIADAAGLPVEFHRIAQSGLPVSGESDPWTMPDPILSPDPADIAPLDDVEFACPTGKPQSQLPIGYSATRRRELAVKRGIEAIAAFVRSLEPCELDLLRLVLTSGS